MDWQEKSLDELGFVARGKSKHRPRDASHLYNGPYPFIQTGDVKHANLYITDYSQTYSEEGLAQSKLWKSGTLCITIAANIADTAILAIDACFPDSIIGFIADPEKADVRFIKYLFDALLQKRYQKFTQGSAQDNLSQSKLLSINFNIPPLPIQQKIANILSKYDDLIENNRRRIELLEQSARLLYKEWFVYLRFPGHEHTRIIDGIPEGWEKKTLADLCDSINYGYTASSSKYPIGPKFLRITDIVPQIIDWDSVPFCSINEHDLKKFSLQEGDIVVARTGTIGHAKRIGRITDNPIFASYLVRFRFNQKLNNIISGLFMESEYYKNFVRNNAGGVAQPHANAKILGSAYILVPPKLIQNTFCDFVIPINHQRETLQKQNQKLKQARDILLPKLMNGEIEV